MTSATDAAARRSALVMLLAVNSGFIDAFGYVSLGGAFTSVMTGNMVLLGVSAGTANGTLAGHAATAIATFILGCVIGTRIAGIPQPSDSVWPPAVSRALMVQMGLDVVLAVGWWSSHDHPSAHLSLALLAVNATALGLQSSAVQRFGVPGLSTTYLTGTLTQLVIKLTGHRSTRGAGLSLGLLGGLITGAVLGALVATHVPAVVPLVPLLLSGGVLLIAPRDAVGTMPNEVSQFSSA